jgi:hypothetical protein
MPSTYTVNLGIEKPATGEQSGTWGDTTNVNFDILDQAINGAERVTLSSAGSSGSPNALIITNGAASDGRNKWIEFYSSGDLGGDVFVQLQPNDAEKIVFIRNSLAGSQSVLLFQGTYNSGRDLEIPAGVDMVVKFDGGGASAANVTDVYNNLKVTGLVAGTADINGGTVDGTVIGGAAAAALTATTVVANTSLNIAGTTTISSVLDEDNMASDSATALATQQSIKAYVDSQVGTVDTLSEILANGNTTGANDIDVDAAQKVQFRDAAIYINSSVDGQLDIVADTEIQIAATTIDINGAINASGEIIAASLDISGNVDIDGITNLDVVDIDGAVQIDAALTVGVDDTGYDVKFFGATGGKYMLWNQATDTLDVVGSIEFDSLSGTGAVAITDIKDEDNMASDSATALATQQSIKAYVDAQVGTVDTLAEVLANGNTTGGTNISFGDDDKAVFGAGSDLQIYHDGANSFIYEGGTGSLKIQAVNLNLQSTTGESYIDAVNNGSVYIYYDNSAKLSTTATGIDVTGTATMDGLTVDGSSSGTLNNVNFLNTNAGATTTATRIGLGITNSAGAAYTYIEANEGGVDSYPHLNFYTGSSATKRLEIADNGDLSLYEDTGTTAKLFWDSSAEYLSVGSTTGTFAPINYIGSNGRLGINNGNTAGGTKIQSFAATNANGYLAFEGWDKEYMRIDSSGRVGIGTTAPSGLAHFYSSSSGATAGAGGDELILESSATTGLSILSGTSNDGNILFGDSGNSAIGYVQYKHADNALAFGSNGSERMRIDASGNVGIGVTTVSEKLQVDGNIRIGDTATGTNDNEEYSITSGGQLVISANDSAADISYSALVLNAGKAGGAAASSSIVVIQTNNAEAMRIDSSGNVGIGTSSPSGYRLNVSTGATGNIAQLTDGVANTFIIRSDASTLYAGNANNYPVAFVTNNTERMRIDSSGNLGLGVVPSSWAANTFDALQLGVGIGVGNLTARVDGINAVGFGLNWYYGGGATSTYVASSFATNYVQEAGTHKWLHAASGTAGAALTFTESMRINSSGQVSIGSSFASGVATRVLTVDDPTNAAIVVAHNGVTALNLYADSDEANIGSYLEGANMNFFTTPSGGSVTERMRITSGGALEIGPTANKVIIKSQASFQNTTLESHIINADGTGAYGSGDLLIQPRCSNVGSNNIVFGTSGGTNTTTERMRIDASGNLLVGTTAAVGKFSIEATPTGTARSVDYSATGGTVDYYIVDNVNVGSISVTTTATAYNTSSDARLKENIADAESASELIDAIQVRSFDWKADGSHQDYGMVAQELMTVAPEAVSVPEDPEKMMGVDYSKLVPMLIKEVQSLRARIAALES